MVVGFALVFNLLATHAYSAQTPLNVTALNRDYQKLSTEIYSELSKNLRQCRNRTKSLKHLNKQIIKLASQKKGVIGVCLIHNHLPLILNNLDSKEIFPIFQYLLDRNNISGANKIYSLASLESDQSFISNLSFIYAQYFMKRNDWKKVLQYTEGTYNDLTKENANLARLYTGIALQKLKQHRKAVKIYLKIPHSSMHYPAARLNIATAYIRQDWWTDAHIEINKVIKDKSINTDNEMINRLYLVLGYSLLRKEFHRDSREAFRNIKIDSIYFNKALLGIALTAANQEDFIGALNAVNILKSKEIIDLAVDESYLLQPYIYEKLQQNLTASASYTEAQTYYKNRIDTISEFKKHNDISALSILTNKNFLEIKNNIFSLPTNFSADILNNNISLIDLSKYIENINNEALIKKFKVLLKNYGIALKQHVNSVFDKRITYLERHISQSRYGLARLFDHSNLETQ
ncbi:MAG: hypothetical protein QM484_06570 [Woeseiaceae bacterium]